MLRRSFRGKIILPTFIVLSILVAILNFYVSVQFLANSNSLIEAKIIANTNSLRLHLEDSKSSSRAAAFSMALNANAQQAIKARDRDAILHVFTPMCALYRVSYFTVCDEKGTVLARTYDPEHFGDSILSQQNIQNALDGRVSSYFEGGTHVKVSIRTGVPVYDTDGTLIGVVSAGVRFDTNSAVDSLKKLLNSEVAILLGNKRLVTTIRKDGQREVGTTLDPNIAKIVLEERREYSGDANIRGVKYKTFYKPLLNARNVPFATFFIGIPIAEIESASTMLITEGFAIGLIGLLISLLLLYKIISSISVPLVQLANDMDNIADGNLKIDLHSESDDEIGRLNKSLQHVVHIIHKLLEDINIMIAEQKKGNADYSLDIEAFHGDYKVLADQILELATFGMRDKLTGLPNRRSFDNRLDLEWNRAIREKSSIGVLLMDVDKFKIYNDTYGHQQGDVALQAVASALVQPPKRTTDFFARWGGEEFIVLLPNTDLNGSLIVAEQLRARIESTRIPCAVEEGTKKTVSIGVSVQIPTQGDIIEDFIAKADEALYKAKETGRNKVMFYEGGGEQTPEQP